MIHFIVNPNSCLGKGKDTWEKVRDFLEGNDIEYNVHFTKYSGHALDIACSLTKIEDKVKSVVIVVLGGDGTLNEVVNGICFESNVTLAYVPAGSGNDFARSLKIKRGTEKLLAPLISPRRYKAYDYGVVCGGINEIVPRRFVVSCGMGFDASICHELLNKDWKKIIKQLHLNKAIYIIIGLKQIIKARPVEVTILMNRYKKVNVNNMWFTSVHIHPYEGGGFKFAPKANPEDGKLEVCVVQGKSKLRFVLILLKSLLFGLKNVRGVKHFTCKEIEIKSKQLLPVHTDGESYGIQNNITIGCVQKKLRILM